MIKTKGELYDYMRRTKGKIFINQDNKYLGGTPADSLNGTTVLNTIALLNGTDILRVHDVKAAVEAVKLVSKTFNFQLSTFNC